MYRMFTGHLSLTVREDSNIKRESTTKFIE